MKPRGGFSKYYADLLDLVPGTIPLFTHKVPRNLIGEVLREQFTIPVVAEFDTIGFAFTDAPEPRDIGLNISCRPVPVSMLTRIYFRNEKDRKEVLARKYEGVEFALFETIVEESKFDGADVPLEQLTTRLSAAKCEDLPEELFILADRVAGSVVMGLCAAEQLSVSALDVAKLSAAQASSDGGSSDDQVLPHIGWPAVDADPGASLDEALFAAATHVLRRTDRHIAWDPLKVLREVHDVFIERWPEAPKAVVDMLRKMWLALKMEIGYPHFEAFDGAAAGNALLWTLSDPKATGIGPKGKLDLGPRVRLMTALLSGSLSGFELLPSTSKPKHLYFLGGRLQAAFVNSSGKRVDVGLRLETNDGSWRLVDGGQILTKGARAKAAASEPAPPADILAACRKLGWLDCLKTIVHPVKHGDVIVSADGTVTINGDATVETVVDMEIYRRRLSQK